MKKILNWTLGSVFRTFGRIFAYLIAGGIIAFLLSQNDFKLPRWTNLLGIETVHASTDLNWSKSLPELQQVLYKDCTGSSTCNTSVDLSTYSGTFEDNSIRKYNTNTGSLNISTNGSLVMVNSGNLKSGYIYQVNFYVCGRSSLNPSGSSFYISAIDYDNPGVKHNTYEVFSSSALNGSPFYDTSFNSCRKFESLIVPNGTFNWLGFRLKNVGSGYYLSTIGYEVNELGIYSAEIQSIVNSAITNNHLATSSQLNTATQQIQTEQQNTTNAVDSGFNSTCSNVYNMSDISSNCWNCASNNPVYSNSNLTINCGSGTGYCYYNYTINVTANTNYYLKFNKNVSVGSIQVNTTGYSTIANITGTGSFNSGNNTSLILSFYSSESDPITYSNIMLSKEDKNYCVYGSTSNRLDETNNALNSMNDTLNNDDTTGASSEASSFFSNFNTDNHGLTGIITAPLNAINTLTSSTCSPLHLPIPFLENKYLDLPCMRSIYVSNFGDFMNLYDIITLGIISYWVMVRIFTLVKDFKNPEHDEVEVMDL